MHILKNECSLLSYERNDMYAHVYAYILVVPFNIKLPTTGTTGIQHHLPA